MIIAEFSRNGEIRHIALFSAKGEYTIDINGWEFPVRAKLDDGKCVLTQYGKVSKIPKPRNYQLPVEKMLNYFSHLRV